MSCFHLSGFRLVLDEGCWTGGQAKSKRRMKGMTSCAFSGDPQSEADRFTPTLCHAAFMPTHTYRNWPTKDILSGIAFHAHTFRRKSMFHHIKHAQVHLKHRLCLESRLFFVRQI